MKFLELQIKGFGKFQEQTISFEDGIKKTIQWYQAEHKI